MRGIASYNLIDRKLNINNPFQFFTELKYHSEKNIYDSLMSILDHCNYDMLYEEVLRTSSDNLSDWSDLISNKKGINSNRYLNDLDMCLRSLDSNRYITCNYRTKFNAHKDILDMKIVELNILDKGRKTLNDLEILSNINREDVLKKCVTACSLYVSGIDILNISRDELIENFDMICNGVSDVSIIEFDNARDRGVVFNYYEGQFVITDLSKFKKFVNDNDNFKLEKMLNEMFHDSTLRIMELKIILNALKTNNFESIYTFVKEDKLLDHIAYLTNVEYIRLDYSYAHIGPLQRYHDIKIHSYIITELGEEFFKNNSIHRMKDTRFIVADCVKDLKAGIKQKNYKDYFNNKYYLKDMLVFNEGN